MGRTKPTDYSKLVIYKIRCLDENITDFYVGSTTCFKSRKSHHKYSVENSKLKIYETIRANGSWENWSMVEIELYPCNSSTEARIREEYWRVELQSTLNSQRAYRSDEELKKDINLKNKEYYEKNKEVILKKAQYDYQSKVRDKKIEKLLKLINP
jgi:hypothetical protein